VVKNVDEKSIEQFWVEIKHDHNNKYLTNQNMRSTTVILVPELHTIEGGSRVMQLTKKYKAKELINFSRKEDLELDKEDFGIVCKQRVNGCDFFKTNIEEFLSW
ncbi:hypothetical protein RhiirA5_473615, partial [Rhizophagus irregularis]